MKARQLIERAAFGPDALTIVYRAFDEAWSEMASSVGDNPLAIEAARLTLANAILAAARQNIGDPEALKREALGIVARQYPEGRDPSSPSG